MRIRLLIILCASVVVWGCDTGPESRCGNSTFPTADVSVTFEGFDEHMGRTFRWLGYDDSSNTRIERGEVSPVVTPTFIVETWLVCDRLYRLDFYADVNGNDVYDAPPIDHAWRLELGRNFDRVDVVFQHNDNHVDIQFPDPR